MAGLVASFAWAGQPPRTRPSLSGREAWAEWPSECENDAPGVSPTDVMLFAAPQCDFHQEGTWECRRGGP